MQETLLESYWLSCDSRTMYCCSSELESALAVLTLAFTGSKRSNKISVL